MRTNRDKSNVANVGNFEKLINVCISYGTAYNPSNDKQKISYLNSRYASELITMNLVNKAKAADDKAIAARQVQIDKVRPLATRILNAFSICDVSEQSIQDVASINKKIHGVRIGKKKAAAAAKKETAEKTEAENAETTTNDDGKNGSVSQQTIDNLLEHFDRLIETISIENSYNPNEIDLKVDTLEEFRDQLKALNTAAIETGAALDNARYKRDLGIYGKTSGLVHLAFNVKKYVRSIFGANSPQFKEINAIPFFSKKFDENPLPIAPSDPS